MSCRQEDSCRVRIKMATLPAATLVLAALSAGNAEAHVYPGTTAHGGKERQRQAALATGGAAAEVAGHPVGSGPWVSLSNPELKLLAFDQDYDFNLPPPPEEEGRPVNVEVSVNLRNILQVDEKAQLVTLEMTIRLYWMDARVRILNESVVPEGEDYIVINPRLARYFWIPDLFVDMAKDLREPTMHVLPGSLRVYKSSMLRWAARINFDVACNMDFRAYPGDTQTCEVKFESFGYSSKQLSFTWLNSSNINGNISLHQFDHAISYGGYNTHYYAVSFPGFTITLRLSRKLHYHLVQSFIPSGIYLTVSWLALFIQPEAIAERLAMAMTIMLTLTTMFASERQSVPRVSYITYLDVWMLACILGVFVEIAEFTLVLYLGRSKRELWVKNVERGIKVILPVLFIMFNIVFWGMLLTSTDH